MDIKLCYQEKGSGDALLKTIYMPYMSLKLPRNQKVAQ